MSLKNISDSWAEVKVSAFRGCKPALIETFEGIKTTMGKVTSDVVGITGDELAVGSEYGAELLQSQKRELH